MFAGLTTEGNSDSSSEEEPLDEVEPPEPQPSECQPAESLPSAEPAKGPGHTTYIPPHLRGRPADALTSPKSSPEPGLGSSGARPWHAACRCLRSKDRAYSVFGDNHYVTRPCEAACTRPAVAAARSWAAAAAARRQEVTEPSPPLLGTVAQFCAAFYHIEPTPEDGIAELCLSRECGGPVCPRKSVVCVARVQRAAAVGARASDDAWTDTFVGRYFNCWQGATESTVHAERFLLADAALGAAVAALPDGGGRLLLYLTYQPCHHSGGHRRTAMGKHATSCTELLLKHVEDVLRPRGLGLKLRIAYLYRVHWAAGEYDPK